MKAGPSPAHPAPEIRDATLRVVLHIGLQKTGSTAMQRFLELNADRLAPELAVFTPRAGTPAQIMGRCAIQFSRRRDSPSEAAFVDSIHAMRAVIAAQTVPCLISHENLVGAVPVSLDEPALFPMIERILALLVTHLAPFQPEIALYTRGIDAWKRSLHNQIVRTDGYAGTLADYLAVTAPITGFDGLEARLVAVLGRARVTRLSLEDEPDPMRPGQALLRIAGVSPRTLMQLTPLTRHHNESLNAGSLEFMRRVNSEGFIPKDRHRLARLVTQSQPLFATSVDPT